MSQTSRMVVIGLDGTPFSLLRRLLKDGELPHLAALLSEGSMSPMTSTIPTVSSVAWASFMTGNNPARHNIYGFTDRRPGTYDVFIPSSRDLVGPTLWDVLGRLGKRVVVMNVPSTYPPTAVNGILVSGFLTPSVDRSCVDPAVVRTLKAMGYRIDVDPALARESLPRLMAEIRETLLRRAEAMFHFLRTAPWDFFMTHFMETDRLHHFFWEHMEQGHPEYAPAFLDIYREVDRIVGRLVADLPGGTGLVLLSDHGFCTVKREVYVNRWLEEQGLLAFTPGAGSGLGAIDPASRAFSLTPGRIYVNLRGREPKGSVAPGDYERVRDDLVASLTGLRDPDSGARVIDRVLRREEIFHGPGAGAAPDLVAVPVDGYDLKGDLGRTALTGKGVLVGMHTLEDAFVAIPGAAIEKPDPHIVDVMPTILHLMGLPVPEGLDGRSLL